MSEFNEELFGTVPANQPKDEIICIVDRSGSMQSMQDEGEQGLNDFIFKQKEVGKANITIIEFDTNVNTVCESVDINNAPEYKLNPRGMTALFDAIGQATARSYPEDAQKIVVILTDGHENSSKEYTAGMVKGRITKLQNEGWDFVFLGANQDAITTGGSLGIAAHKTMNYAGTGEGIKTAYSTTTNYVTNSRVTRNFDLSIDNFND